MIGGGRSGTRQFPEQGPARSKAVSAQHRARERNAAEAPLAANKKCEEARELVGDADAGTPSERGGMRMSEAENADRQTSCSYPGSKTQMLTLDDMKKAAHPTMRYVRDRVRGGAPSPACGQWTVLAIAGPAATLRTTPPAPRVQLVVGDRGAPNRERKA